MCVTLGTILYFWKLGFIDGSRGKDLHQASYILETYESKNILYEIKDLILNENPKQAIEKIKEIEKDFEKINLQIEVENYKNLKESLQRLKTSAANIISFQKIDNVMSVFNSKMDKFYDYVKRNNWRTLSRMSDRIFSQTNGHINKHKLSSLAAHLEKEFQMMGKITESSVLTSGEKSEILSRIANLQTEVLMIKKYAEERAFYFQLHTEAGQEIKSWLSAVAPELTLQKVQIEQIGRYYVMGLLGIFGLLALSFFSGFVINKFFLKRAQDELELKFKEIISDGLQQGRPVGLSMFSEQFEHFVLNMAGYFHKRMSFGSIFQDALPLSSVLLDSNLKVLWSNKNFSRDWKISEDDLGKDYMSWDYLNKLTNIGSEDPVLEALKHGVAGIYQIQVKPNEESAARPYEMFVAPIEYQGEKQIMLFFYDLTNLEQTIQDQAQSLISPIRKSLNLTMNKTFFACEELKNEFHIAGADDIFEQFAELNNHFNEIEIELRGHIQDLEENIQENDYFCEKVHKQVLNDFAETKTSINALKIFKENVVTLCNLSYELDKGVKRSQEVIFANMSAIQTSMKKVVDLKTLATEMTNSFPKFDEMKEQIRFFRAQFSEQNSKFAHELAQLSMLFKRANDPSSLEKLARTLAKVNKSYSELCQFADELDKRTAQLEMYMSKTGLVINAASGRLEKIDFEFERQQYQFSEQEVKNIKKTSQISSEVIENTENHIINSLQTIFNSSKESVKIESGLIRALAELNIQDHGPVTEISHQVNS